MCTLMYFLCSTKRIFSTNQWTDAMVFCSLTQNGNSIFIAIIGILPIFSNIFRKLKL